MKCGAPHIRTFRCGNHVPHQFRAAVWKGNVYATQFHPEKSQYVGLTMLRNFARL